MKDLLEPILRSPALPAHLAKLERAWQEEQARRQQFYAQVPDDAKWEFINGEIIVHSPAKARHGIAVGNIRFALESHNRQRRLGGLIFAERYLVVFPRNDYEPDIIFYHRPKARHIRPDDMKLPIPDFIVEVLSESTERHDRRTKLLDYNDCGVGEYWIVDPEAKTVEQFVANGGRYPDRVKPRSAGKLTSSTIPGFEIEIRDIFRVDTRG